MKNDIFLQLKSITNVKQNESLKNYTTFKIGGNCEYFCIPKTVDEIKNIISICKEHNKRYLLLGNGSNTLLVDEGYSGVVILLKNNFASISSNGNIVTAQAGANITKLSAYAQSISLTGLEFAYGIPASVGGAVYMNAGAYNGEIKDVLQSVTYLDENLNIVTKNSDQLKMSYRHTIFHETNSIILSADFLLKQGNKEDILNKMEDLMQRRQSKQPLEYPSAGSTFKRPQGYFAAALIEECGLKGYSIGGAMVSTKHSGFIINYNDATCKDVLNLIEYVKSEVYKKKGVTLECEVRVTK